MNTTKQILANLIGGDRDLLGIDPKFFTNSVEQIIFKHVKDILKNSNTISKHILEDFLSQQSQAKLLLSILKSLPPKSLDRAEFLATTLANEWWLDTIDNNLEYLITATKSRDTNALANILKNMQQPLSVNKTPQDIRQSIYGVEDESLAPSFIRSMTDAGFYFTGLNLIGGASGGGKSIFLLNQILFMVTQQKQDVVLFNLELPHNDVIARLYSTANNIEYANVFRNKAKIPLINKWIQTFKEDRLRIISKPHTREELILSIRDLCIQGKKHFFIDYANMVKGEKGRQKWEVVTELALELHQLTLEFNCVIYTPVQVNLKELSVTGYNASITVRGATELLNSCTNFLLLHKDKDDSANKSVKAYTVKGRNTKSSLYVLGDRFNQMAFDDLGIIFQ